MNRSTSLFILAITVCLVALCGAQPASASTVSTCDTVAVGISCTGALSTPEDLFLETFTLSGDSTIAVQTYGFGGGTNAAGNVIAAGGFDSLVALFSGPPASASILTSGGNPVASADALTLFSPGCPPAGTVTVGSVPGVCGDNLLTVNLLPGTYTLLLSDALYIPSAVDPGPPISSLLSDGFSDLSPGFFQTCASLTDCNTDTGNFAVDILSISPPTGGPPGPAPSPIPEPADVALLSPAALLAFAGLRRAARFRRSSTDARRQRATLSARSNHSRRSQ